MGFGIRAWCVRSPKSYFYDWFKRARTQSQNLVIIKKKSSPSSSKHLYIDLSVKESYVSLVRQVGMSFV